MHARKNSQLGVLAVIVMILLLLLNAYLLYNNYNQKKTIQDQEEQVEATNKLKLDLEKEYYNALSSLEELRSDNDDLNEMIEEQKDLLKDQKEQIGQLITENRDINYIKNKIEEMRIEAQDYLAEIETLRKENVQLTERNIQLKAAKDSIESEFTSEKFKSDSLAAVSRTTKLEKVQVEKENLELSETVAKAAAIDVTEIESKGYKISNDGSLKRRRRAKNVELVEVCFETTANDIAETGTESFYIRIIDPQGKTMVEENKGSGIFTETEGKSQVQFTQKTQVRYSKSPTVACIQWRPEIDFEDGIYEIEVYNKGFLVGKSTFKLR